MDAVDGRMQQAAVGGELLEGAETGPGAQDGHEVAGLHLLIDEAREQQPHAHDALEGQREIVHHEGEGTPHGLATQGRPRRGRREGAGGRRRRLARAKVRAERDLLPLAVLEDLEVSGPEVGDVAALLVCHHRIHLDDLEADADHGSHCGLGGRGPRARGQGKNREYGDG